MYRNSNSGMIQHTFRPFSFMFVKGESTDAFVALFRATITAMDWVGIPDFAESIGSCVADRSPAAYAAFEEVFLGTHGWG